MIPFTHLYLRFRWLHVPGALLVFLLQRTPVLRAVITTEFVVSSSTIAVLKGMFATAAALGTVQTVAGATALDPAEGTVGNPANGTVGQPFTGGFAVVGAPHNAGSYEIRGTLPPGLTVAGMSGDTVNASVVSISGTPTQAGDFPLSVRAWKGTNKTGDGGRPTFTYTISIAAAAGTAPSITGQPVSQTVNEGDNVNFSVTASGDPTPTYQWRKDGANLGGATAATLNLSNVSTSAAGSYTVVVSNSEGSVTSSPAVLTVNAVVTGSPPAITTQPVSQSVTVGGNVSFSVAASGDPAPTFQWRKDGAAISGATATTLSLTAVSTGDAGSYTVVATNSEGSVTSNAAVLTVSPASSGGLAVVQQPVSQTVAPGGGTTLAVGVSNTVGASYQWFRNGVAISGATGPTLALNSLSGGNSGRYHAVVSQGGGSVTTRDAYLLVEPPNPGGIINESVLTTVKPGDPLTVGFVLGDGSRSMLLRGVGPSLGEAPFNIGGSLPSPKLALFRAGVTDPLEVNVGWANAAPVSAAGNAVGAFALATARDAAVLRSLEPAPHSAVITSDDTSAGLAIVEAYLVPGTGSGRLLNLSALKRLDDSNPNLTAGFSIDGNVPLRVLVRAVGPSLHDILGGSELGDPVLTLNRLVAPHGEELGVVAEVDDWFLEGNAAEITSVAATIGAFPLAAGQPDAAVLVTLPPGNYSAQVQRKGAAVGSALVEVYLVE